MILFFAFELNKTPSGRMLEGLSPKVDHRHRMGTFPGRIPKKLLEGVRLDLDAGVRLADASYAPGISARQQILEITASQEKWPGDDEPTRAPQGQICRRKRKLERAPKSIQLQKSADHCS